LIIPHERMLVRQFVLIPLVELLPDSADSVTGKRYRDICNSLPDQGILKVGSLYGN
jgi:7,8-dihydro-6-hydroxymethylpterin-pyrophosphokinase